MTGVFCFARCSSVVQILTHFRSNPKAAGLPCCILPDRTPFDRAGEMFEVECAVSE